MKNILVSLLLFSFFFFHSSCTRFITPVITGGNNIGYLPRPMYADSVKAKNYVSAEYATSSSSDGHLTFNYGSLKFSRGHTYHKINLGYGVFGFAGQANYSDTTSGGYYNEPPPIPNFKKSFYGGGLRTTIGYQVLSKNGAINFRVINWENAFSLEKGDFANYRKQLYETSYSGNYLDVYVSNLHQMYSTGLSSEIIFKNYLGIDNLEGSIRLFVGYTPNLSKSYRNISSSYGERNISNEIITFSTYLRYHHIFGDLQIGGDQNFGAKFAVGYAF